MTKNSEAIDDLVIQYAYVNRKRTGQQAIDATGCIRYTDKHVVKAMPRGEDEEVEIIFFNLGRYVSDAGLEKEYELLDLDPVDPYTLAAFNEADPAFADQKPNATHWKNSKSNWCYAGFTRCDDGTRRVDVNLSDNIWFDFWWFAGVRKVSLEKSLDT